MNPVIPLFLLPFILLAAGCGYQCSTPDVYCSFYGYDSAQLAIVIVREYERSSPRFSKLISTRVSGSSVTADIPGTDTVYMGPYAYLGFNPKLENDYTIEIPAGSQLFRLRDFSVEQERDHSIQLGERDPCSNTISYYLNDKAYSGKGNTTAGSAGVRPISILLR